MMHKDERLFLKLGTISKWENLNDESFEILKRYMRDTPFFCVCGGLTVAQKETLCELIDSIKGDIILHWVNKTLTKASAKAYIRSYDGGM